MRERGGEVERGKERGRLRQRLGTLLSDWPQGRSGGGFLPGIGPATVIKATLQEESQPGRHAVVLLPAEKKCASVEVEWAAKTNKVVWRRVLSSGLRVGKLEEADLVKSPQLGSS